jgi:D-glycero-D-manno-heptose 1,7-bisphosphate phosphatase
VNAKIQELLPIDDIKICFHTNGDNCGCRKPRPGMLIEAAQYWNIDLRASFMVGDRYGDVYAGMQAGCKTILIGAGDAQGDYPSPDYRAELLIDAVKYF